MVIGHSVLFSVIRRTWFTSVFTIIRRFWQPSKFTSLPIIHVQNLSTTYLYVYTNRWNRLNWRIFFWKHWSTTHYTEIGCKYVCCFPLRYYPLINRCESFRFAESCFVCRERNWYGCSNLICCSWSERHHSWRVKSMTFFMFSILVSHHSGIAWYLLGNEFVRKFNELFLLKHLRLYERNLFIRPLYSSCDTHDV